MGKNTVEASDAGPAPETEIDEARVRAQIVKWQQRLLDQTRANPLLGINRSRVSKLRVTEPLGQDLFQRIVVDDDVLTLPLVQKGPRTPLTEDNPEGIDSEPEYRIQSGEIALEGTPIDIFRRTRRIFDNARTTVTERGVTTLYLSFGLLDWEDPALGESRSPLLMIPCQLEHTGPTAPLKIRRTEEEIEVNPALELYLRERHRVSLPAIPDVPVADSLAVFVAAVRQATLSLGWTVSDEVWLSTYTFEALAIYKDLAALADLAVRHPIVAALARATPPREGNESLGDEDLEPSEFQGELVPV